MNYKQWELLEKGSYNSMLELAVIVALLYYALNMCFNLVGVIDIKPTKGTALHEGCIKHPFCFLLLLVVGYIGTGHATVLGKEGLDGIGR